MFTVYRITFAPAGKPCWIELLFTHKNSDFGVILKGAKLHIKQRVTYGISVRFVMKNYPVWCENSTHGLILHQKRRNEKPRGQRDRVVRARDLQGFGGLEFKSHSNR